MRTGSFAPFTEIDLDLPDRRDGKVRALVGLRPRAAAVRHHRPAVGVRPRARRRAVQGPGAQPAVGVVVRAHRRHRRQPRRVACPTRTPCSARVGGAAAGRGRRARPHHRRHRHVDVGACTPRVAASMYGYHFPDGLRKNTPLPEPIVTPTTKADRRRPRRAAVVRRGRRARPASTPSCGSSVTAAALAIFARGVEVGRRGRADPRRHEVRVRPHRRRRADPDRRGAHARLVALLGRRHATRSGSPPARSRRASTRRSSAGPSPTSATGRRPVPAVDPDEVWTATTARYIDAYERLTGHPFEPGDYPVADRLVANLHEACDRTVTVISASGQPTRSPSTASGAQSARSTTTIPRRSAACSASRRRTATASPSWRSSGCSPCSTAARRRPASP